MQLDHADAGAGRRDDVIETFERVDDIFRDFARVAGIAGVIGWLSAAGLTPRSFDRAAGALKQGQRGEGGAWPEQIDKAGDEQPDVWFRVNGSPYILTVS
jgi:hypothetical protein